MQLERAKRQVLEMLAAIPEDGELCLTAVEDPWIWLGMGYAVSGIWAVYRGNDCFQITRRGRDRLALMREEDDAPSALTGKTEAQEHAEWDALRTQANQSR